MQDEIVARLASALNAHLVVAEARRAEQAPNPRLDGPLFSGYGLVNKGRAPDNLAQARIFFDRALTADPDNIDVLIGLAVRGGDRGRKFLCDDPAVSFAAAEAKLTKALSSTRTTRTGICG